MINIYNNCCTSVENYVARRSKNLENSNESPVSAFRKGVYAYTIIYAANLIFAEFAKNLNASAHFNATSCPKEFAEINLFQRIMGSIYFVGMLTSLGAGEELLCREVIQTALLKEGVSSLLGKVSVNLKESWEGTNGKIARIALMAILFSAAHIFQYAATNEMTTRGFEHAVRVLPLGLLTATFQETDKLGVITSIGLHCTNNAIATSGMIYRAFSIC